MRHCRCDVFTGDMYLDDEHLCMARPTQEDLLCDPCRDNERLLKEMRAGEIENSGIHSSGVGGEHGHYMGNLRKRGVDFEYQIFDGDAWQSVSGRGG